MKDQDLDRIYEQAVDKELHRKPRRSTGPGQSLGTLCHLAGLRAVYDRGINTGLGTSPQTVMMRIIFAIERDLNDRRGLHLDTLPAYIRRKIRNHWKGLIGPIVRGEFS